MTAAGGKRTKRRAQRGKTRGRATGETGTKEGKTTTGERGRGAGGPLVVGAVNFARVIHWRGLELSEGLDRMWRTARIALVPRGEDLRSADWKAQPVGDHWYGRLRIGSDRFPGRGTTAVEALDAAASEALEVAAFIAALVPPAPKPAAPRRIARARARRRSTP